jgi:uncharacterized repeat protein (TIGR01451 family)
VQIGSVSANNNLGAGISVLGGSDVYVDDVDVINNPQDGVVVDAWDECFYTYVEIADSYAADNGWGDGLLLGPVGDIEIQNGIDPIFGGFRVLSDGEIQIGEGTTAEGNTGFGFCLYSSLDSVLKDALAEDNLGDGFNYGPDCVGVSRGVGVGRESTEEDVEPTFGVKKGFEVQDSDFPAVVISNTSAISNSGTGFALEDPFVSVTLTNISALRNLIGVEFTPPELESGCECGRGVDSVSIQAPATGVPTLIYDSLIQSNTAYGLLYQQDINFFPISTNSVHSTILCENGVGLRAEQIAPGFNDQVATGVVLDSLLTVDARGTWWGSATGPTHANNSGGTGDSIETESLNIITIAANRVDVQYAPWINTLQATAVPSPTLTGIPVALEYRFRDGASDYFLENGVGDPYTGPLFRLSATNGTILDNPPTKTITDTYITGTATPAAPGIMAVRLEGPCDLSPTLNVPVATPAIGVTKSPATQIVPTGQDAVFTVTVQNLGDIPLTNITVADAATPSCSRALANLAVGGSATFNCTHPDVTSNFVNIIEAEGVALLETGPAGARISDTASADVIVAGFVLTKTAFVDGYREFNNGIFNPSECALASAITVPVSSTVKYCYTITNTGGYTLSTHTLEDDHLGTILSAFPREVGPGQSFSTVDAGVKVTSTLYANTTNIATWTADATTQVVGPAISAVQATVPVVVVGQATVTISAPGQDQDVDGIPDNEERTGDWNNNGIPDYLDPLLPTNEPPTDQPSAPGEIYLPSLGNN